MESLVSYGSDDDQDFDISQNTMGRTRDARERDSRDHRHGREEEDNYDNVGMDMSDEESNNNSSPHRGDDRRGSKGRPGYSHDNRDSSASRVHERSRSRNRDNSQYSSKAREEPNNRYSRKSYDEYKCRSRTPTKGYDSKSRFDNRQSYDYKTKDYSKSNYDRKDVTYDTSKSSRDKRKNERRRSSSRDLRRSSSKERNNYSRKRSRTPPKYPNKRRSKSRDRKERSRSRDRRDKSKSRDRKDRSKSDERRDRSGSKDYRDRADSKEHTERFVNKEYRDRSRSRDKRDNRSRSPLRFKGRYDRTSNKLAVLEKLGIEIKTPDCQFITPQMLMQKSIVDKIEEVKNATGIELPKYYNPAVMNPSRYAEQIQKRRLLWGNKSKSATATEAERPQVSTSYEHPASSSSTSSAAATGGGAIPKVWQQTKFVHDNDGKVASKFKRLMGIKDDAAPKELTNTETLKKQEEMFHSMEAQYEVARAATHTMRGVGLGFGAFTGNFPR